MVEAVFVEDDRPSDFSHPRGDRSRLREARDGADRLTLAHLYLCRRGARKFWRTGLERSDLEQVAAIGLLKAARRYDAATRTPFEAYAWLMIVGELMHHVRDHEHAIRVPRRIRALDRRLTSAHEAASMRLGREPSDDELAGELGVLRPTLDEVRRARESLHATPLDAAEAAKARARDALDLDDRLLVGAAFRGLATLERRIVVGVYVLGLTQLELGQRLGISAKRVSRAHHAALAQMRRAWAS